MSTEKRLINLIVEHFTAHPYKRLTASALAEKADISRQYIYQNFDYLLPYIKGKKPATELIASDEDTTKSLLLLAQSTIQELNAKLEAIDIEHKSEISRLERSICTSLMNNDISIHDANEVRITLEKQALQFDHLVSENQRFQNKINELNTKLVSNNENKFKNSKVITIVPDLSQVFKDYHKNQDIDSFEEAKDLVIEKALLKLSRLPDSPSNRIVVYIERYYCQFVNVIKKIEQGSSESLVLLYFPVHTIAEIKLYLNKIKGKGSLSLSIPFSDREAVTMAQRKFHFSSVPAIEFEAADKMLLPAISDGFDEINLFRVNQGD